MQPWTSKILGIALGNTLVLYDYILYGFLGSTLSTLFFPNQNKYVALMSVFLVYASACLVRPLGAFIFGLIGDKYGRKTSLISSILLMSSSSVLIGCLPTYQTIGSLSVLLLVALRVIQGFAMSGEEVGSSVYLIESAPAHKKSLAGSIVLASVHFGLFIGAGMILICLLSISHTAFMLWGWRIPFLLSLPMALVALYFRLRQADSNDFNKLRRHHSLAYPLKTLFQSHKLSIIMGIFICSLSAISIYLYAVYIPNFLKVYHHFSTEYVLFFSIISFVISTALVLAVGYWGDKTNLIKPMRWATVSFIVLSPMAFYFASSHALVNIILAQLLFIIIVALASGTLMALLNSLFPTEIRFTGVAICFNFSMMIFGSTAPIVILALQRLSVFSNFPSVYMILIGIIGFAAVSYLKKTASINK